MARVEHVAGVWHHQGRFTSGLVLEGTVKRVLRLAAVLAALLPVFVLFAQREEPRGTLQLDALTLPAGFSIALFADNVPGARSMSLGPDGTVFVGTRTNPGEVMAVVDRDGDYRADSVVNVVEGLNTLRYVRTFIHWHDQLAILNADAIASVQYTIDTRQKVF